MRVFKNVILKSMFGLAVCVMLALPQFVNAAQDAKYSSLVIDAETGAVLHQENAGKLRYPASLTKMMTLYLAFQALDRGTITMNQQLRVSAFAAGQKPSVIGFRPGQTISVKDAINGVIIKSANDASVVLAEAIGGTEAQFAVQMTRVAKKLGMNHTNFANASGLPNDKQVTTAYDLARLAVALRRDYPKYYPLFANNSFTYNGRTFYSHNRVTKSYRGADGLKTGYIRASGFNLVTSARRGGKSLVGVVMGGRSIKSRDTNMVKLLDQAFYKISKTGAAGAQVLNATPASEDRDGLNKIIDSALVGGASNKNDEAEDSAAISIDEEGKSPDDITVSAGGDEQLLNKAPVPVLRTQKVNTVKSKNYSNEASNTKDSETFSRDVVVSSEMPNPPAAAVYNTRKDIFSPTNYAENTKSDPASVDYIKPIRVKVRGKMVPKPVLKSAVQDKGFVHTNSPHSKSYRSVSVAAL